jgi:Ni,Fe-hydrogenase I cytochrome b subunit
MTTASSPRPGTDLDDITGIDEAAVAASLRTHAAQVHEAQDHDLMGCIRFTHFAAGYVLAVGLVGRAYCGLVGNHRARELFTPPELRVAYWKKVFAMAARYPFLRPRPSQYVGHNPMFGSTSQAAHTWLHPGM